ncbi:EAL domain-containing protein [Aquabacter cavernae]|uniref:bifunctional diguanylate cyclase/phosphodiesterase n=1 Tax=Aquabacter cavernae TaxID=2496029 RepID=UPI000F8F7E1F|nr:EAL domain-containing protein [Aquabacter cavernae]
MRITQAKILVAACFAIAITIIAGSLAYVAYERKNTIANNYRRIENASAVLAEFVSKAILGIDRVLDKSSREIAASGGQVETRAIQAKLADFATGVTGLSTVFALDSTGRMIANSRLPEFPYLSFSDRPYFREISDGKQDKLYISETVVSRVLNTWQFFASRPIRGPDGHPLGVICASIDTALFENVLSTYRPDSGIVISLLTTKFRIVAQAPSDATVFARTFEDNPALRRFATTNERFIAEEGQTLAGDAESLNVLRHLPDLPLILAISVPTEHALAEWRALSRAVLSLAGLMSAVIIFVGLAGARSIRNQEEVSTLLDTMFTQTPACIAISNVNGGAIKHNENWISLSDMFAVPEHLRGDVFASLRHAIRSGGDQGLTENLEKALRDLQLVSSGLKSHASLELRCIQNDIDRYFTVNISRIDIAPGGSAEGFAILVMDISKQRALELRLRSQLVLDSKTGLPNREGFLAAVAAPLSVAANDDCLFVFDIVGLAGLKEFRGFEISDEAFSAVGATLATLSAHGCLVARTDSEKFCVFVCGPSLGHNPEARLHSLVTHLSREYPLTGHTFLAQMTVGAAHVGAVGHDGEKLLQAAEIAHGLARRRGQGSYAFFSPELEAKAHERVRLYEDLQRAVSNKGLELEYQPKVNLSTGEIIGAEALVRWRHPTDGPLSPAVFIPVAEESGLIVPLGEWVIGEVMRFQRRWLDEADGVAPIPISLNVSHAQFDRVDVALTLKDHLVTTGIDPSLVTIELTETVFSREIADTVRKINQIRDMGFKVSLDDFGTGYSSLSYLNLMNFDELKIDGSFVHAIDTDLVSRSIVDMTLRLGGTLDVSITAEGIETERQREALVELGCHTGQGFLFSRSVSETCLKAMVRDRRHLRPDLLL